MTHASWKLATDKASSAAPGDKQGIVKSCNEAIAATKRSVDDKLSNSSSSKKFAIWKRSSACNANGSGWMMGVDASVALDKLLPTNRTIV